MVLRIDKLAESLRLDAQTSRKTLEDKMGALQASNEQRLEQMRQTVDEKLHATLEARLGESFKLVSERLEAVQKGLGEMKVLADGVGDLKKVMGNVKTRGTWGEVQLRALIEDILRPEEFATNWAPRGRGERVEFAIRLPGHEPGVEVYLPIDSKFPVEDYQRLVDAQEVADLDGVRIHGKALEDRIKACAKDICDKYLQPGVTTEFGLLFLPFEGLYAEVLRRPGLVEQVQRQYHVAVCGPTTLGALLNSLRMGFRAVAIQKRSGDIGALLGAVKHEFGTFGQIIDGVGKKLRQAQDDIDKVGVRTRAINRKLKDVEAVPALEAERLLPLAAPADDADESLSLS
ncbi:MAG: DNA recombination protein RmuC [Deltaproteobacteria bacterium]|nr:DNA recombination protein RmuC [Deltaproteobacteria bacterium]